MEKKEKERKEDDDLRNDVENDDEDDEKLDADYLVESGFAQHSEQVDLHGQKPSAFKRYWKTIIAALFLLLVGLLFIIISIFGFVTNSNPTRSIAFLVVGLLCSLPGGYQCYVLYQAFRNTPGFSFHQIPSYDL